MSESPLEATDSPASPPSPTPPAAAELTELPTDESVAPVTAVSRWLDDRETPTGWRAWCTARARSFAALLRRILPRNEDGKPVLWSVIRARLGLFVSMFAASVLRRPKSWAAGFGVPGLCLMSWMMFGGSPAGTDRDSTFDSLEAVSIAPGTSIAPETSTTAGPSRVDGTTSSPELLSVPSDGKPVEERPSPFYAPEDVQGGIQPADFTTTDPTGGPRLTTPGTTGETTRNGAWLTGTIEFDDDPADHSGARMGDRTSPGKPREPNRGEHTPDTWPHARPSSPVPTTESRRSVVPAVRSNPTNGPGLLITPGRPGGDRIVPN